MCADVAQRDVHFPDGPLTGTHAAQSGPLTGAGSLGMPDLGSLAPSGSALGSHPRPAGRERQGVRFAPCLEKVSEGQSASPTDGSLADSPGTSPPRPARPGRCCHYLRPSSTMRQQLCCASSLPRPTQTLKIIALNAHSRHCNGSACRSKADWAWTHVLHQICQLFLLVCTGCLGWEISPPASWTWQATRPLTGWRCPLRSGLGIPPAILHIPESLCPTLCPTSAYAERMYA